MTNEEIRRLLDDATPGPWIARQDPSDESDWFIGKEDPRQWDRGPIAAGIDVSDARLIAAAPTIIAELLRWKAEQEEETRFYLAHSEQPDALRWQQEQAQKKVQDEDGDGLALHRLPRALLVSICSHGLGPQLMDELEEARERIERLLAEVDRDLKRMYDEDEESVSRLESVVSKLAAIVRLLLEGVDADAR